MSSELEAAVEEESRAQWNQKHEDLINDNKPITNDSEPVEYEAEDVYDEDVDDNDMNTPIIDIDDEE
jgi:DNA gyrase subunit A